MRVTNTILIVDDEPTQCRINEHIVTHQLGYRAQVVQEGQQAIDLILQQTSPCDLVLLDLNMPKVTGFDVLRAIRPHRPNLPVIVLTSYGDMQSAVEAMRAGASDFISKPVEVERLRVSMQNLLRLNQLDTVVERLQRNINGEIYFSDLIGKSLQFIDAVNLGKRAAASNIPVLIEGESGVGKELFARAIHGESERVGKPFIAVNCGAIPDNLVESILFGHEKGSFTGAVSKSLGKFREADGGTLFLDEVGELKQEIQVKLLRALQQKEIEPVGAQRPVKVDIRIISATNRNLQRSVQMGSFREDLFYRLNVFPLRLPSLKERKEDIPLLVEYFLERFSTMEHKEIVGVTDEALEKLMEYLWPGNIRQLENAIFRAVVLSDKPYIGVEVLSFAIPFATSSTGDGKLTAGPPVTVTGNGTLTTAGSNGLNKEDNLLSLLDKDGHLRPLSSIEEEVIRFGLKRYHGKISVIAKRLKLGRSTLYRKMMDFGIE
jgi:DNA-binding NtrC family response regulator